jgi:hypothetical protein
MFCIKILGGCALLATLAGIAVPAATADEQGKRGEIIKKFDKDGNGQLDQQEREAAKKELQGKFGGAANRPAGKGAFAGKRKPGAANPGNGDRKAELMKRIDKNGDGKIDDDERAAAKAALENLRAKKATK